MLYKFVLFSFLICGASIQIVSAQQSSPQETPKGKFVIDKNQSQNSNLVFDLPKPTYTDEAKKNKDFGKVEVKVTIDESGNVISAEAKSGPETLRVSAENAALKSKFKPTLLAGNPVKVTGIIVYNFILPKTNWFLIGLSLFQIQKFATLKDYYPSVISDKIKPEWTIEKEKLESLEKLKKAESESDKNFSSILVSSLAKDLTSLFKEKLSDDIPALETFSFGVAFAESIGKFKDDANRPALIENINQNLKLLPSDISVDFKSKIEEIISILNRPTFDKKNRDDLVNTYTKLLKTPPIK